ncbi:MAG: deoxyribodipyrimidine photo-lyase, partial [Halobacteria archaeon]|nr:deoxyribodipyrimidine photo-lyase [Halobacteria archaeon]
MTAVVWVRRSLREHDNTALVEASRNHGEVVPLYIIDENLFESTTLGYPRVKFWHDSLTELKQDLVSQDRTLVIRRGKPVRVLR